MCNIVKVGWQNVKMYSPRPIYQYFRRSTVGENITSLEQIFYRNNADGIMEELQIVLIAVENQVTDAILAAVDNGVKRRFEMALRSNTESSGCGKTAWCIIMEDKKKTWKILL